MTDRPFIPIDIVYAHPQHPWFTALTVPVNSNVEFALYLSNFFACHPELEPSSLSIGIFSQRVSLSHPLTAHDRIEIYSPLLIDPKQARVLRANKTPKK